MNNMLRFRNLEAEGFGSFISKTFFNLEEDGLTIMRGPVGSGKTSIPSILYWVLYDMTLKKNSTVQTWEELRGDDFKGTMGKVNFSKGKDKYSIIRCIGYKGKVWNSKKGGSGVFIIKNNNLLPIKGKKAANDLIITILGYSPKLFINSIIYGQRLKRIIEESGPDKKKIFDEAFETLFIDKAKAESELERKDLQNIISIKSEKSAELSEKLEDLRKTYRDVLKFEKSFKDIKSGNLKKLKTKIPSIKTKISELGQKIMAIDILNYTELGDKIKSRKSKYKKILEQISEREKNKNKASKLEKSKKKLADKLAIIKTNKCFECGSELVDKSYESLKKKISNEITQNDKDLKKIKDSISKLNNFPLKSDKKRLEKEIEELNNKFNKLLGRVNHKEELEWTKADLELELEDIEKEYELEKSRELEIKSDKYLKKIEENELKKIKLEKEIRKLNKEKELVDWLIKDPLSNNGIKSYIFNSLLDKVNHRLSIYSQILGFNIEFGIDMESSNKDFYQAVYKGQLIIPYHDLSGGQKQLVDTSVALAIHDVIASVRPTNILFMDEPFEGLDNECIELVADILNYKANSQSVFLITHHDNFNPTNAKNLYFKIGLEGNTQIF